MSEETSADPFGLEPITPSPDGELVVTVACRTSRTGRAKTRHPVTIRPDWSVCTPHDLALERIATAMGGYLSCLDLVDRGVPALRELVQLRARRVLPQITRNSSARWTLGRLAAECGCVPYGFTYAAEAVAHAAEVRHVSRLHGVAARVLERLLGRVEDAHGTFFAAPPVDEWGAREAVRERDGLDQLWDAGIHPQLVARLHREVWPDGPALPCHFYLGAVTRLPDLAWLAHTLAQVPDEDVAVWLCWTNSALDLAHPDARSVWLQAGVPRSAIAALAQGQYTPIDVATLSARSRRSITSAALTLAGWQRADCRPTVSEVLLLDRLDVDPYYEPSIGAVDWLFDRAGNTRIGPNRTEVGLVLAVCGTRAAALRQLAAGVCDPITAALAMHTTLGTGLGDTGLCRTRPLGRKVAQQ